MCGFSILGCVSSTPACACLWGLTVKVGSDLGCGHVQSCTGSTVPGTIFSQHKGFHFPRVFSFVKRWETGEKTKAWKALNPPKRDFSTHPCPSAAAAAAGARENARRECAPPAYFRRTQQPAMPRFLAFGKIKRVGTDILAKRSLSVPPIRNHGALAAIGLPSSQYRFYSQYKLPSRGSLPFTVYKAKESLCRSSCIKNFSTLSARTSMTHHAHVAWKRLYHMFSHSSRSFPPMSKIACVLSLAFTRSQMGPSIFAFLIGEVAWTQRTCADPVYFSTRDSLYMTAQDGKTWLHIVHLTLEKAGPAFIKWGQWAATRPDLFPRDLCTELTKLHTKAPAHGFAYTKKSIEKAFSRKLSDIFEDFEEEPVASGSIAQVHRAMLRVQYSGQRGKRMLVAVKVRHPGVGESIRRDFVIINLIAKISKFIPTLKWLRLDESVQQFAVFMLSQVDLAREAAHLSRFIYNFRRWKDVSFPKPLYPLVHPAVLVETYEHGESVSHYVDELEGNDRIKKALAHIGTHALLKMLLVDNFIHADMHPGNILVRAAHSKSSGKRLFKSRPHVIFIDVGMTAELSKSDRINLLEFFKSVVLRDGRTAAECTLRLSKQQKCPNPEAFIQEVERSFTFWGTAEGDVVHPAECMHQLLEQVRRHKVNIDGNVCTVMVTTLVLEGWQRKLDPDYNVMKTLQTLLFKVDWAQSLFYTFEELMGP